MSAFRTIYKYWVSLLTIAVVLQIGFAGYGAFDTADKVDGEGKTVDQDSFGDSFGLHMGFGYLIFLGTIVLLLLSFGARGRTRILSSLGAVVLLIIQILLAWTGGSAPYIAGALHPINAFIILGFLGSIAGREWKGDRMGAHRHAAAPPPAA
jgi:hypothetical protein